MNINETTQSVLTNFPVDVQDFNMDGNFIVDLYYTRTRGDKNIPRFEYTGYFKKMKAEDVQLLLDKVKEMGLLPVWTTFAPPGLVGREKYQSILFDNGADAVLKVSNMEVIGMSPYFTFVADTPKRAEEFLALVIDLVKTEKQSRKQKINFIYKSAQGFRLLEEALPKVVIAPGSYNISVEEEDIKRIVNTEDSGLVLFTGPPGTGKSYYLRHLASELDRRFVYVPKEVAMLISDPAFIPFAVESLKGSIVLIEDAEDILRPRNTSGNTAVSSILNITDGLFGDILNMKVVCTLNMTDNVDSALLRKGRLKIKAEFSKLGVEQANTLLKHLGKEQTVTEPTTLGDLYNIDKDNGNSLVEVKKIGF